MDALPIILFVFAVVFIPLFITIRRNKAQQSSAAVPSPEELYVPEVVPVTPVTPVETKKVVVIFEDTFRSVRVCPQCDGENDRMARHCRVCGGNL